jgi:hypothetical protein
MNLPDRLLKYTPNLKFLDNGLFRFSQPAALDDDREALPGLMVNAYSKEDIAAAKVSAVRDSFPGMPDEELVAWFLTPFGQRMDEKSFPGLWPFHQPALRNKPFESSDEYDRAIAERAVELANALANRTIGIFSLTEDYNETMWDRYANYHQGVCIAFNLQHAYFIANPPERILYSDEPVQVTINHGWVRLGGQTVAKESILRGEMDFLPRELFFRKRIGWQYQKEWRIIKLLCHADEVSADVNHTTSAIHLFSIPPEAISGITFGCSADNTSIERALWVIKEDSRWGHLWIRRRACSPTGVIEEEVNG